MRNTICGLLLIVASLPAFAVEKLELRGKVKYPAARFRFLRVAIFRVEAPFTASTLTDPGGEFRFRNLDEGTYTISVIRRGLGEIRRSVVVNPALADKKGIIHAEIEFSPAEAVEAKSVSTVSKNSLTIPFRAQLKYADAQTKLGHYDVPGARKKLEEAVKIAPQYMAAWNFLGVLSYQGKDLDKAQEYFRHALSIEPEAFEPNVNLGGVLLGTRRTKEAMPYNEKAVAQRPKDALANSQMGMTLFYLGELERAQEFLEKAKAIDPAHFSMPQMFLSRIHERLGNRLSAAKELEDLIALRPGTPQTEQWRRRLARLQDPNAASVRPAPPLSGSGPAPTPPRIP